MRTLCKISVVVAVVLIALFASIANAGYRMEVRDRKVFSASDCPKGRVFSFYYTPPRSNRTGLEELKGIALISAVVKGNSEAMWVRPTYAVRGRGDTLCCAPVVYAEVFGKLSPDGPWLYLDSLAPMFPQEGAMSFPALAYRIDMICYTDSFQKAGKFSLALRESKESASYRWATPLKKFTTLFVKLVDSRITTVERREKRKEEIIVSDERRIRKKLEDSGINNPSPDLVRRVIRRDYAWRDQWPEKADGIGVGLGPFIKAKSFFGVLHSVRRMKFLAKNATFFPGLKRSALSLLQKAESIEKRILSLPLSKYLRQSRAGKYPPQQVFKQIVQLRNDLYREAKPLSLETEKLYYERLLEGHLPDQEVEKTVNNLPTSSRGDRTHSVEMLLRGIPPVSPNPPPNEK